MPVERMGRLSKDLEWADLFPETTLHLVDQTRHERHPMITKAHSWALRDLSKKHPDQVARYVDANAGALALHVAREVRSKLHTGRKT